MRAKEEKGVGRWEGKQRGFGGVGRRQEKNTKLKGVHYKDSKGSGFSLRNPAVQ